MCPALLKTQGRENKADALMEFSSGKYTEETGETTNKLSAHGNKPLQDMKKG